MQKLSSFGRGKKIQPKKSRLLHEALQLVSPHCKTHTYLQVHCTKLIQSLAYILLNRFIGLENKMR